MLCCIIPILRLCLHDAGSTSPKSPFPCPASATQLQVLPHAHTHRCALPGSCRDTYPNQHLEIHVRLYVYRWDSVNELGAPQVSLTVTGLTAALPIHVQHQQLDGYRGVC